MVEITDIQFVDSLTSDQSSYLLGHVEDKITATIKASIHWESLKILAQFDSATKTITRQDGVSWIIVGFRQGDTFTIVGGTNPGNFTIASLTDYVITTIEAVTTAVDDPIDFHGTTAINGMDFYFNLIPNSSAPSFLSLSDNQTTQKKTCSESPWTVTDTLNLSIASVSHGWDSGTGTIRKDSVTNYAQLFTITHTFFITPLFLSGQQALIIAPYLTLPDYFKNAECLKYVCQIDGRYSVNDPNITHTSQNNFTFKNGNTGWFNEQFNGLPPNFTLNTITYSNGKGVDVNSDVNVEIKIISAITLNAPTTLVLNQIYAPLDENDYVNTSTDYINDFKFDRKQITTGGAPVNGEQFGTNLQTLTNISATRVDNNNVTINFTVSYSTFIKNFLKAKQANNRNYFISVAIWSGTLSAYKKNNVICDFRNVIYNQEDATLLNYPSDVLFYQYLDTTTCAKTDYKGFIYDGILSKIQFQVLKGAQLNDTSLIVQAFNSGTGKSFPLETINFSFANQYGDQNEIQKSVNQGRGFQLTADDLRNNITFSRNFGIDTLTQFGYNIEYGFKARWEKWVKLTQFDKAFTLNHSQDWSTYSLKPGWQIQLVIISNVFNNNFITQFQRVCNIKTQNKEFSDDGFGGTISRKMETFIPIIAGYVSSGGFISRDNVTHVKVTLTGNFATLPPTFTDYYGILGIDIENTGGETFTNETNTTNNPLSNSIWLNKATLTKVSNTTITIEADIDQNKLNTEVNRYLIDCRFGFQGCTVIPAGGKEFQDLNFFNFQDANEYDFQN